MSNYSKKKNGFDFGDFTITKRELLANISIVAVMMIFVVLISEKISEHQIDQNEIYNKAATIEDPELFRYGMNTNIGNAFVHGDLEAVDTVTYPEIGGEYMYIEKVKERYTKHTRKVSHSRTVNGKTETYYTTEVYWTWDSIWHGDLKCKQVKFCGAVFDSDKLTLPTTHYIGMIKESHRIRYQYYGTDTKFSRTIFANLHDGTIPDHTKFYDNMTIEETKKMLESDFAEVLFWILWIALTCGLVFVFCYADNKWLE